MDEIKSNAPSRLDRLTSRAVNLWNYCWNGVWSDTSASLKVRVIKIINLSARSFFDADLQTQACSMTYSTLLAVVPAMALLFAIGRGFGLQSMLQEELYKAFPSQHIAISTAMRFIDSYLTQASEGIFVGVGIVFLLWTLISLVGSVEDSFNKIWRVRHGRNIWRKITDYTAIFLILPILMICASGISLMLSTTLRTILPFDFMSPAITFLLEAAKWAFTWFFFAGAYMLIPNTSVKFSNALIAGIFTGTGFQLIQWLFMTGQLYVSKYNAIYGSFSFLPLLLLWLQLTWLITLTGAVLCFASQNVGEFNFFQQLANISYDYRRRVTVAVATIIAQRFSYHLKPLSALEISSMYGLPVNIVQSVTRQLEDCKLITGVVRPGEEDDNYALQPTGPVDSLTVGDVILRLQHDGSSDYIPDFDTRYASVVAISDAVLQGMLNGAGHTLILSLDITHPDKKG